MSLPSQLEPPAVARGQPPRAPRALLIAWEYPGAHSRRGTALARRVGQVAKGLAGLGWSVTALHRLQRDDDPADSTLVEEVLTNGSIVRRRAIRGPAAESNLPRWMTPVRKLSTFWTALRSGDRSGRWAANAIRTLEMKGDQPADIVLAFFTPRGPLAVASALHARYRTPWIADLQDPWWEGTSPWVRRFVARWMRTTLRSAAMVVQVSPEWAAAHVAVLQREVRVVRHAVPVVSRETRRAQPRRGEGPFRILYAGSLNEDHQDLNPFMDALSVVRANAGVRRPVEVQIAGGEESWLVFERAARSRNIADAVVRLGWLTESSLRDTAEQADCLLLIPMFPTYRQGVPSKLFEYLAYDTPVLVAGPDSGGMTSLLQEWVHPPVVAHTASDIAATLRRALEGDTVGLLERSRCGRAPLSEEALAAWYSERMQGILEIA